MLLAAHIEAPEQYEPTAAEVLEFSRVDRSNFPRFPFSELQLALSPICSAFRPTFSSLLSSVHPRARHTRRPFSTTKGDRQMVRSVTSHTHLHVSACS